MNYLKVNVGFDKPIIPSWLWTDFYKFSMGQFIWKFFPDIIAEFGFINRTTKVKLGKHIDRGRLKEELDHVKTLGWTRSELHYLNGTFEYDKRMFEQGYVDFLRDLVKLTDYDLEIYKDDLFLNFPGIWKEGTYWETMALPIINSLYYEDLTKDYTDFEKKLIYSEGRIRLAKKINLLRLYPELTFADFGTRRAFNPGWQDEVVETMTVEMPNQFIGTSNVYLAMKYGLVPVGTSAHEPQMILVAYLLNKGWKIDAIIRHIFDLWWDMYGYGLSINLPDTFGTDFYLNALGEQRAGKSKGNRQDSGNPIVIGEKYLKWYEGFGIDTKDKLTIFSDGLTPEKMIEYYLYFQNKTKTTNGWGTNLTNDLGFEPISSVIKPKRIIIPEENKSIGLVKLSDNLNKSTGDKNDVESYKQMIGYTNNFSEKCVY